MDEGIREAALKAYEAMFSDKKSVVIDGRVIPLTRSSIQGLRTFRLGGYSCVEQNPAKSSAWAQMSRQGHHIMWVMEGRRYVAQVRDGVFHGFERKAKL